MEYFKVNAVISSKIWIVDKLKMLNTQNMANAEEDLYRVWKDLTLNSSVGDQSKYRLITINHLFAFVFVYPIYDAEKTSSSVFQQKVSLSPMQGLGLSDQGAVHKYLQGTCHQQQ